MTAFPASVYSETTGGMKPGFEYDVFNNQYMRQLSLDSRIDVKKKEKEDHPEEQLETKTEMIEKDTTDISKKVVASIIDAESTSFVPIEELVEEAAKKRENRIIALLIRPQTREIIEELSSAQIEEYQNFLNRVTPSDRHLQTLAELINENLLTIENNAFCLTDLCQRFINNLVEDKL